MPIYRDVATFSDFTLKLYVFKMWLHAYRDVATFSDFTIKSYVFKMWLHAYIET